MRIITRSLAAAAIYPNGIMRDEKRTMRRFVTALSVFTLMVAFTALAQEPTLPERLPDGRSRKLAILKSDHEKSLEDIARIRELAAQLEEEIQQQTAHVNSLESMRKAEKIEELAKSLQKRMKRMP